jgi:hypothetical protein
VQPVTYLSFNYVDDSKHNDSSLSSISPCDLGGTVDPHQRAVEISERAMSPGPCQQAMGRAASCSLQGRRRQIGPPYDIKDISGLNRLSLPCPEFVKHRSHPYRATWQFLALPPKRLDKAW